MEAILQIFIELFGLSWLSFCAGAFAMQIIRTHIRTFCEEIDVNVVDDEYATDENGKERAYHNPKKEALEIYSGKIFKLYTVACGIVIFSIYYLFLR